jgi:hypothetical protein
MDHEDITPHLAGRAGTVPRDRPRSHALPFSPAEIVRRLEQVLGPVSIQLPLAASKSADLDAEIRSDLCPDAIDRADSR